MTTMRRRRVSSLYDCGESLSCLCGGDPLLLPSSESPGCLPLFCEHIVGTETTYAITSDWRFASYAMQLLFVLQFPLESSLDYVPLAQVSRYVVVLGS